MSAASHMARQTATVRTLEAAPESAKRTLSQAFSGVASPRGAIKAQCLVCTGYDRDAIRNCTGWSCPLWQFRPFVDKAK